MEQELLQRFDKLVDALGDMGGHVYDLAVKQAIIDGITDLGIAFAFLLAIAALWVVRAVYLRGCKDDPPGVYEEDRGASFVLCGVVSLFAVVLFGALVVSGARKLANPEWHALQEIAKSLGLQ